MDSLEEKVKEIASKLTKYQTEDASADDTKNGLVRPLLEEIGWDFEDIDTVQHQIPVDKKGSIDYALKIEGQPRLFVEAKPINVKLDAAITEGTEKAREAGVAWLVATNGAEFQLLKVDEKISEKQGTVFHIRLSRCLEDQGQVRKSAELIGYLSRESVSFGKLESFAMRKLKQVRTLKAVQEYLHSREFLVGVQKVYRERYQGDKVDIDTVRNYVEKISLGIPGSKPPKSASSVDPKKEGTARQDTPSKARSEARPMRGF
jgi:hypothetical protein